MTPSSQAANFRISFDALLFAETRIIGRPVFTASLANRLSRWT